MGMRSTGLTGRAGWVAGVTTEVSEYPLTDDRRDGKTTDESCMVTRLAPPAGAAKGRLMLLFMVKSGLRPVPPGPKYWLVRYRALTVAAAAGIEAESDLSVEIT